MRSLSDEHNITVQFVIILTHYFTSGSMGKRALLSISEKQELSAYRDQFPLVSQQNTANHVSLWHNIS